MRIKSRNLRVKKGFIFALSASALRSLRLKKIKRKGRKGLRKARKVILFSALDSHNLSFPIVFSLDNYAALGFPGGNPVTA